MRENVKERYASRWKLPIKRIVSSIIMRPEKKKNRK